jgi:hypothetical protein
VAAVEALEVIQHAVIDHLTQLGASYATRSTTDKRTDESAS